MAKQTLSAALTMPGFVLVLMGSALQAGVRVSRCLFVKNLGQLLLFSIHRVLDHRIGRRKLPKGGDILNGVDEDKGLPTGIPGVTVANDFDGILDEPADSSAVILLAGIFLFLIAYETLAANSERPHS